MTEKYTIAVWVGNGIGGTEKAAVLYAVELARRGHRTIFLCPPGPRDKTLKIGHVRQVDPPSHPATLADFLKAEQVDVVHQHVPGYPMPTPIYPALQLLGESRPHLIETNVFGRMEDPESDQWVDCRCFVSRASGVQAFQRSRRILNSAGLKSTTVLFNPLAEIDRVLPLQRHRAEIRSELGVQPEEIFILRLGRPGNKWNRNEVHVFQQARRQEPRLRMLLMEPPPDIWREVEAGQWGEGIILRPTLSDFEKISAIYTSGDLMLHMPDWGESYGYTIAEAMQQGLPLIVNSTPWGDNAQVELVEHGVTGFVCNSCEGAAHGLLELARSLELRRNFGTAAKERIRGLSDLSGEVDLLEEIMRHLVGDRPLQKMIARNRELLQFQTTFAARERRVLEQEVPGLKVAYLKGRCYQAYRGFRAKIRQWKQNRR